MYLSSRSSERDTRGGLATGTPPQRAGLRVAPPGPEPTGVFVVVEMAVLVIVTALAMASIIVSGAEEGRDASGLPASAQVRPEAAGDVDASRHARAPANATDIATR